VIHYADGQQRVVPILYGFDVRNWWPQENEPSAESTGLIEAWKGPSEAGGERRLYRTAWQNPRPDVEVTSIDYRSSMALAAPFLVAITAEP
jgi:hypothetical protein